MLRDSKSKMVALGRVEQESKELFTWRWGTPGRCANPLRWGNPPVHIIFHFNLLHDRWGDPPHATSPIRGPPPPCKQALTHWLSAQLPFIAQSAHVLDVSLIETFMFRVVKIRYGA